MLKAAEQVGVAKEAGKKTILLVQVGAAVGRAVGARSRVGGSLERFEAGGCGAGVQQVVFGI